MDDYVELHASSAFSFLRGGSTPEELVKTAWAQGLPSLAITDRMGVYGAVRTHMLAKENGLKAHVGAELVMEDNTVFPVLAATRNGYQNLCRLLTSAKLRAAKGEGRASWCELRQWNEGLIALTGDLEGPLLAAWHRGEKRTMESALENLLSVFGADRLYIELQRHHLRDEDAGEDALTSLAYAYRLPLLATNGVKYATPADRKVADVFTCLRNHTTVDQAGKLLEKNAERHLKNARLMKSLFSDRPEAIRNTQALAERLEFTLSDLGYRFPNYPVPADEDQDSFLRKMTFLGARQRYGPLSEKVRNQLDRELALIGKLGFSGYFLVVWDLCNFAREQGILVQGRGSAANSAVCYALGITAVDPIACKLLFERFLSEGRSDWPDIDLDFPSGDRRETIIQEVYRRYGKRAAMTANVISYRSRSTMREVGKVLGFPEDVLDRYTQLFAHGDYQQTLPPAEQMRMAGMTTAHPRTHVLLDLVGKLQGLPRHLGQHSGGMVLCATALDDIVPMEPASMEGRVVIEWDKSDCEDMGIVKVDLLGLGMMAVLQDSISLCEERGRAVDLAHIPKDDPAVFALMTMADTIGVFQIESRAQMATLPRMKPACFYDVAIEVAIIRPGPIHGEAVNPYLERRAGRQAVTYLDERARPVLERTLGVVLFQEQVLSLAMTLAQFSAAEADELRRAIGFTRSPERLERMKTKLRANLGTNGVQPAASESIVSSLSSFALYGFPESHALSFALLAYASAWLKVHRPAEFTAALLNNQPMGFYSPATIVQDARRHGLIIRPVCVASSELHAIVMDERTIRIGFQSLRGVKSAHLEQMVAERAKAPFSSVADLVRRTKFTETERRILAGAGALNALGCHRREALWEIARNDFQDDLFSVPGADASAGLLTPMNIVERIQADFALVGLTAGDHPMKHLRGRFPDLWKASELPMAENGTRVRIGGSVICRQRPGTAKGFVFISLEDESGVANAVVRPALFERERLTITQFPALVIEGVIQSQEGVIHLKAETIRPLRDADLPQQASHDFH
jgi:error-prone DNA polymerase